MSLSEDLSGEFILSVLPWAGRFSLHSTPSQEFSKNERLMTQLFDKFDTRHFLTKKVSLTRLKNQSIINSSNRGFLRQKIKVISDMNAHGIKIRSWLHDREELKKFTN